MEVRFIRTCQSRAPFFGAMPPLVYFRKALRFFFGDRGVLLRSSHDSHAPGRILRQPETIRRDSGRISGQSLTVEDEKLPPASPREGVFNCKKSEPIYRVILSSGYSCS